MPLVLDSDGDKYGGLDVGMASLSRGDVETAQGKAVASPVRRARAAAGVGGGTH